MLMLLSATLVSTSFTVGAAIANQVDPIILTLLRFIFASALLLPYVVIRHGLQPSFSLIARTGVVSCCLVVFFWCMFLSLRYTSALNTSILFTLVPSIAALYAYLILKERMSKESMIGLLCGIIGALWVVFKGDILLFLELSWNKGDGIFFLGCLGMGLYTILVRLLYRGEPMALFTLWILITGSAWLLVYSGGLVFKVEWQALPTDVWYGLGYLALFSTVITFFITQLAILYIGPTKVMAYSYLYPSLVLAIDFFMGNGLPDVIVLPGVLVVLIAMYVLLRKKDGGKV